MLRILCPCLLAFLLSITANADPLPINLSNSDSDCSSEDDVGTLAFRFFSPSVRIEGKYLIVSVDDSFYRCSETSNGELNYVYEQQTQTSALEAQYWTLFDVKSWGASFVGGKIIRSASAEIPIKMLLSADELKDYQSGISITKTLYLFLNSALTNGLSQGNFDITVTMQSGAANINSFH